VIPLIGGWLTGNRDAYTYLPETSAHFPAGDAFLALMDRSGAFSEKSAHRLSGGIAYIYVGTVA
jgi:demethylmenaquinone methyltransferase/2-methoxy-6-polyprenyl-1,4-benzoquinol methylase